MPRQSENSKVLPAPATLLTEMLPPIMLTRRRQIDRPSPVPPNWRVVEVSACSKASKIDSHLPAGMPMPMMQKIAADVRAIVSEPGFRDKNLLQRGLEPVLNTPREFAEYLRQDRASAKRVVDQAGLEPQ